jgi:hypothetical protein
MAPFLAEPVPRSRLAWIGGMLIALAALGTLRCEEPPAASHEPTVSACHRGPLHVYVDVGRSVAPHYDERVLAVAMLTLAEHHPEWRLHLAAPPLGRAPDLRLTLSLSIASLTREAERVECTVALVATHHHASSQRAASATVALARSATETEARHAEDACLTTAVEAVVVDR